MPLAAEGFDMSATQFRDQLALRYHHTPTGISTICDGCGADFTVQHALDCKKGGLVKQRHDQVRDNDVRLAEEAWGGVVVESVLAPENDRTGHPSLQADWCDEVCGKVAGLSFLIIALLMLTPPATFPPTSRGLLFLTRL